MVNENNQNILVYRKGEYKSTRTKYFWKICDNYGAFIGAYWIGSYWQKYRLGSLGNPWIIAGSIEGRLQIGISKADEISLKISRLNKWETRIKRRN